MESSENIKQQWLHEARVMGVPYLADPERMLWSWPMDVRVSDALQKNESRAVWEHGVIFIYSVELPPNTLAKLKRINGRFEEPWVPVLVTSSIKTAEMYTIEAVFVR